MPPTCSGDRYVPRYRTTSHPASECPRLPRGIVTFLAKCWGGKAGREEREPPPSKSGASGRWQRGSRGREEREPPPSKSGASGRWQRASRGREEREPPRASRGHLGGGRGAAAVAKSVSPPSKSGASLRNRNAKRSGRILTFEHGFAVDIARIQQAKCVASSQESIRADFDLRSLPPVEDDHVSALRIVPAGTHHDSRRGIGGTGLA